MLLAYTGTDARLYPEHRDAATGRTLSVTPGGTYDVTAPPGVPVPPGDGRWGAPAPIRARRAAPRPQPPAAPPAEPRPGSEE